MRRSLFSLLILALWPTLGLAQAEPAIVAVFDIEFSGLTVKKSAARGLNEYLFTKVAAAPQFQVVPQAKLRAQLMAEKAESYKQCYDESCQIEIGKELAAEKSLSTKILKLGDDCLVTVALYDLRTAATEAASDATGGCGVGALVRSVEAAALALVGPRVAAVQPVQMGVVDKKYCPLPETRRMGEPYPEGQSVYCMDANNKMHGTMVAWHNTGKPSMRSEYRQGKLQGDQTIYYPGGAVLSKGSNEAGRKTGEWTDYYDTGKKRLVGTYSQGQKTGLWTSYRLDGTKDEETHYVGDLAQGRFVSYHPDGGKDETGNFEQGKRSGLWTEYRSNGKLEETRTYKAGQYDGLRTEYNSEGLKTSETPYVAGKVQGLKLLWAIRDGEPKLTETIEYHQGRRNGANIRYEPTGQKRSLQTYENDEKTGPAIEWRLTKGVHYKEGEGAYVSGKKHGVWRKFDPEGDVVSEQPYVHGQLEGACTFWRKERDGQRWKSGINPYKAGKRHGAQITFKPDGTVASETMYEAGQRVDK